MRLRNSRIEYRLFSRALTRIAASSRAVREASRVNGRAPPGKIVSHHINIDEPPVGYKKFDERSEGYTKALIRFGPAGKKAAA